MFRVAPLRMRFRRATRWSPWTVAWMTVAWMRFKPSMRRRWQSMQRVPTRSLRMHLCRPLHSVTATPMQTVPVVAASRSRRVVIASARSTQCPRLRVTPSVRMRAARVQIARHLRSVFLGRSLRIAEAPFDFPSTSARWMSALRTPTAARACASRRASRARLPTASPQRPVAQTATARPRQAVTASSRATRAAAPAARWRVAIPRTDARRTLIAPVVIAG